MDQELPSGSAQPPYPFKSGDNLLNLTRVHNVRPFSSCPLTFPRFHKYEMIMISMSAHNLATFT